MTRLNESERRALVNEFVAVTKKYAPDWTTDTRSDPGITLIELFAWLVEQEFWRSDTVPEPDHAHFRLLLQKVFATLTGSCNTRSGLTRPRYYSGQLLTADDLVAEQNYFRERLRRHNRCMCGHGIVTGLEVSLDGDDSAVIISPGCAITDSGEEIHVSEPLLCVLSTKVKAGFVTISFCEQCVPGVASSAGDMQECARVEEGVSVQFGEAVPVGSVVLARVTFEQQHWVLDAAFLPAREMGAH